MVYFCLIVLVVSSPSDNYTIIAAIVIIIIIREMISLAWVFPLWVCCLSTAVLPPGASADETNEELPSSPQVVVLSSFHVSTQVNSRLMNTTIAMVFDNNSADCSAVHSVTLQLPRNARVTDLSMDLDDGCTLQSRVKSLEDAVDDFEDFSSDGKAAALLTAWDTSDYNVKVSVPPGGSTSVLLKYQELLVRKLDRVSFQVPVFPGSAVDDLKIDVSVEEPDTGLVEFHTQLETLSGEIETTIETESLERNNNNNKASMHYEARGVSEESSLPRLATAYFRPGPPPEDGLFLSDGECFTHVFNPEGFLAGTGSMARSIVFVIDVSGSMTGQKLRDVKDSFGVIIDTLNEQDTFIIQAFSDRGTQFLWGPRAATTRQKVSAKKFVMRLSANGGTNINAALTQGIARVIGGPETVVPILVFLTDGHGGDPVLTSRLVREKNKDKKVKIFALAFGRGADMDLVTGIAIQNGGRVVRIYEGFDDGASQMELFYKQELGSILMSDISVLYGSGAVGVVEESTVSQFSVLAAGSEIVVRGKMHSLSSTSPDATRTLRSIVSANSAAGPKEWPVDHVVVPGNSGTSSDCRQSFAQARIAELLEYRNAERSLGPEFLEASVTRSTASAELGFEEQARKIALDAQLVWPGLTALVTIENDFCQQNETEVCYSGVGTLDVSSGADYEPSGVTSGCSRVSISLTYFALIVLSSVSMACCVLCCHSVHGVL